MFRQRKRPTLMDRLPSAEVAAAATALRDRASEAADTMAPHVGAARDAMAPHVGAAREAVAPHLDSARAAVSPQVSKARDKVRPKAEAAVGSLGPSLTAAAKALEQARLRLEQAAQTSEAASESAPSSGSAGGGGKRGRSAPPAGRDLPHHRIASLLALLGLGVVAAAVGGVLTKRKQEADAPGAPVLRSVPPPAYPPVTVAPGPPDAMVDRPVHSSAPVPPVQSTDDVAETAVDGPLLGDRTADSDDLAPNESGGTPPPPDYLATTETPETSPTTDTSEHQHPAHPDDRTT